ncbi:MAG: hypothetical protein ACRENB_10465, partial [Gemmatimonadales bacterium]
LTVDRNEKGQLRAGSRPFVVFPSTVNRQPLTVVFSADREFGGPVAELSIGGILIDPAGIHESSRQEREGGRDDQLRIEAHQLGKPHRSLLGLRQMLEYRIEHTAPPFLLAPSECSGPLSLHNHQLAKTVPTLA